MAQACPIWHEMAFCNAALAMATLPISDVDFLNTKRSLSLPTPVSKAILFLMVALLVASCAPIASVHAGNRLGVLAPFEGLYRRSGYNALAAVREALESAPDAWLPVALDTSRDPERAARKILAPRNTNAIVGPLTPNEAVLAYPALFGVDIHWLLPFAQVRGVPVAIDDPAWLTALVEQVATSVAPEYGVTRITIAGSDAILAIIQEDAVDAAFAAQLALPAAWIVSPEEVNDGDLVLWLGDAAEGVRFVSEVRAITPNAPVWLPIWAAGDIFVEHASVLPNWNWQGIQWGGWLPVDAQATESLTPVHAETLQVANVTRHAIADEAYDAGVWEFVSRPLQP